MNIRKRFMVTGGATLVVTGSVAIAGIALSPMAIADFGAVTATTAVNIRTAPSLRGTVVGVLYTGQKLTQVAPITDGWVPVSYGGQTRYIAAAYLLGAKQTDDSPATNDKGTTGQAWTTAVLNVRPFASINNTPIGLLQKGAPVTLTGLVSGQFSQIKYGDGLAWVATSYLATTKPDDSEGNTTLIVGSVRAKTALAVRNQAGDDTGAADIPGGTVLPTTGRRSTSLTEVVWQNARVWVTSYWVETLSSTSPSAPAVPSTIGTRYATTDVNVRSGPGTNYSVVGSLPRGGETQVTGTVTNGFAAVVIDGATRWISAQYLSSTKPAASESSRVGSGGLDLSGSSGLAGLEPNARNIVNVIASKWGLTTFYGVRPDPLPDHPSGHAVDAMIPNYRSASQNAMGWEIANYLRANARSLGVQYVIFDQKIWNIARDKEGWRPMADRGGDTANHRDHVHVTTVGM